MKKRDKFEKTKQSLNNSEDLVDIKMLFNNVNLKLGQNQTFLDYFLK